MSDTVTPVEKHVTESLVDQEKMGKLLVNGSGDRYEVEWDADAKVTPMGSLVFFAQYLQTGGLMDRLCQGTPLAYSSNNAPKERDVLGTIVLSILNGQTRYGGSQDALQVALAAHAWRGHQFTKHTRQPWNDTKT